MGLKELAGYVAVAGAALSTGYVAARWGLRPEPFYLGVLFVTCGLGLSVLLVRETRSHVRLEAALRDTPTGLPHSVFWHTSVVDQTLSAASQAGLVNNLNDGMAWGLFPLIFTAARLDLEQTAVLTALYPMVWGFGQIATGAMSDRTGRKWLIATGMWVQAGGIAVVAGSAAFYAFAVGAVLLGLGTAMVYPTLLAAIGDVAAPTWRATAIGVYRFWRDLGYALGAVVAGILADALGLSSALWAVAALTLFSGVDVALRMNETRSQER